MYRFGAGLVTGLMIGFVAGRQKSFRKTSPNIKRRPKTPEPTKPIPTTPMPKTPKPTTNPSTTRKKS